MTESDIDRIDVREELHARGADAVAINDFRTIIAAHDRRRNEHFPIIELDGKTVICLPDTTVLGERAARLARMNISRAFTITSHNR